MRLVTLKKEFIEWAEENRWEIISYWERAKLHCEWIRLGERGMIQVMKYEQLHAEFLKKKNEA